MNHPARLSSPRQRKLAAWLGVFAVCLVVLMPLLTQGMRPLTEALDPVVCSASHGTPDAPGDAPVQPLEHLLEHCGYCNLLTHTPVVASGNLAAMDFAPSTVAALPVADAPLRSS
ncbi:MAG: DUF2946 domain-containing protein, partial [Burkholderiaceae bacterium]|nr:DUF2946 domain-containing protein [Burkholderiaceae bacterium]